MGGSLVDRAAMESVEELSRLCSLRLPALSNYRSGDCAIAYDHLHLLTGGRCHFSADRNPNGGLYRGAILRFGAIEVQYFDYTWEIECQTWTKRGKDQNLVIHIPLSGGFVASQLKRTVEVSPGRILIVANPGDVRRRWQGPCQLLNVVIPLKALNRVMLVEFGMTSGEAVPFEPLTLVSVADVPTFLNYLRTVISDISCQQSVFKDPVLAEQAASTLLQIALKSLPHGNREAINDRLRTVLPFYMRRAEDYIREHIREDLSIGALAEASGVSVRSIFYGFKRYRKASPMKYVRWTRLRLARNELLQARIEPLRISEIAGNFGYGSATQFSRDYKYLFGESPSATLNKSDSVRKNAPEAVLASA